MNRLRRFTTLLLATGFVAAAGFSQAAVTEGKEYKVLPKPQAVEVPGKAEVIEFFWYGCPHCHHLNSKVDAWEAKLPKEVNFRREHVMWNGRSDMAGHVKLFVALKALGLQNKLSGAAFKAIHQDKLELRDADVAADWAAKQGVNRQQFEGAYNSFGAQAQFARSLQLTSDYQISSVPTFIVNGKYVTSAGPAGGEDQLFAVINELLAKDKPAAKAKK